jgi:hypothetical protein
MPAALKAPLTKAQQRAVQNQFKHQEAQAARAARSQSAEGAPSELAVLAAAGRRKVIHTKTGLEWLRDKKRLDPHQFRAGRAYGMLYRVAILPNGVRLRSCLDDTPRSGIIGVPTTTPGQLAAAEWLADSRVRLDAARVALGSHPGMILACDLICGQGLTPRDVNPAQREAEKLETTLRIALDLAHAHFASAGWPGQSGDISMA